MQKFNWALLDLRGLVLHSYYAGMTPEPIYGEVKDKINTGTYGFSTFLNMYYDLIVDTVGSPLNIIAVLEGGNAYRKGLFPDYKKRRGEAKAKQDPQESAQIDICMDLCKKFLAAMGVPLVKVANVEADDTLAYLAAKLHGNKVIYTKDQDLIALSNETTYVQVNLQLSTQMVDDAGNVIPPNLISLHKSLVGDKSDEYGGVPGFGPKAWSAMVEDFGLDGMEQLDALIRKGDERTIRAIAKQANSKPFNKIVENMETWRLMYRLASLTPGLCEGAKVKMDWYKRVPTLERLTKVLEEGKCPDLLRKYEGDVYQQTLVTKDNLAQVFGDISKYTEETPFVAWDYETYDPVKNPNYQAAVPTGKSYVDMLNSLVTGCSFAVGRNVNRVYYFSARHKDTNNVDPSTILAVIKHFEEEGVEMVAQNVAFEATITKVNFNHELAFWEDTKLYAHHLDEDDEIGLKHLSKKYLNYNQVSYADTLKAAGATDMSEISGEQVLSYGCDDSVVTAHLKQFFNILTQLEGTYSFIHEYECPAVAPLVDAHIMGVKLDRVEMAKQTEEDRRVAEETMTSIRSLLEANCREPNLEAVEVLYKDQLDYQTVKAKEAFTKKNPAAGQAEISAAVREALASFKLKLKQNSFYTPPVYTKKFKEFIPTPTMINKVGAKLGIPPLDKVSSNAITDWVQDNELKHEFIDLLIAALPELKAREGAKYTALKEFCDALLIEDATEEVTGTELNLGSPSQNQYLFYLLLGLPIRSRTKVQKGSVRDLFGLEGSPATDEAAVEFALANDCAEHPWKEELLRELLRHKSAATRLSIYWGPYPLWLDDNDIMHPGFSSCGTVTRRPTGTSPNLLQVSKGNVRKVFIPRSDDNVIVSIDFSSEELRVLASVCQDTNFLSAYTGVKDKDLHTMTACSLVPLMLPMFPEVDRSLIVFDAEGKVDYEWFGKSRKDEEHPLQKFLETMRGYAKTANFGVGYGAAATTISRQLMIPMAAAELVVESLQKAYPGIQTWKDKLYAQAKLDGYVATTYGSRRHVREGLLKGSRSEISRWERQLSNFMIQGQCADLLKVALVEIHKNRTLAKHGATLIAPIYDELLFECPKTTLHSFLNAASCDMERAMPGIIVPMVADCSFGKNWGEQIEVGVHPSLETVMAALEKL